MANRIAKMCMGRLLDLSLIGVARAECRGGKKSVEDKVSSDEG